MIFSVLVTAGLFLMCCQAKHPQLSSEMLTTQQKELAAELKDVTKDYLVKKIGIASLGGKPFCAYKVLEVEENGENINEYVDAICQEYYIKGNGKLEKGTGIGLPVALVIRKSEGTYKVVSHQEPRDGDESAPDIERIFPKKTQEEIAADHFNYNHWGDKVWSEIETDAKNYYNKN